jgi:diaminopimelate decarboxylase
VDHVRSIVESYFPASRTELSVGDVAVSEIAELYGTPLFAYDRSIIDKKWNRLRDALPPAFSICYSVKANPNQAILRCLLAKRAGLEIASGGEFCQALNAGCPVENIIFAGPGKTEAELDLVVGKGIGEIHVESLREAERIAAIAERRSVRARVALRVNPSGEAEGGAMRMGGRPAPFGLDEENVDDAVDQIRSFATLDFRGIHLFTGTQILDPEILVNQYRKGFEIARRVAARLGRPLHTIDFGGGFGVPYFQHEVELDLQKLKEALNALLPEMLADPLFSGTRLFVEPGRYLVAEAGIYVCRVNDIKVSRGKKFLIVDGGMNHHLAASGNLGQTLKRNYPVAIINKLDLPGTEIVDVVGPLCTPLDVLARGVNLPGVDIGDLVGIFQSGAYGRSASPLGFLSHMSPPEVWVDHDSHRIIRRRGKFDDYLSDQCGEPELEQRR